MPQYTIQSPTGQTVTLEGDAPPTEQDLNQVFSQVGGVEQTPTKSLKYSDMEAKKNPGTPLGVGEVLPGLARGVVQGGQEMLNTVANINELVGSPGSTGPRDLVNASRKALDVLLPPSDSIAGKISEGIGQLPGMVTTYGLLPEGAVLPVAGVLGGINSQQEGASGMVKGAAKNMLIMSLLKYAQGLKDPIKAAALGGVTSGGAAALSGEDNKDIIAQSALGAGFSLYPKEQHARIQKDYQLVKDFMADPKGNTKSMFNVLREDPTQRVMRKVNEGEAQLKTDLAEKNSDLSQAQRQAIENAKSLTAEDRKAVEALKSNEQKRADEQKRQIEQDRAIEVTSLQNEQDQFMQNMPDTAEAKAKYIQNNYKRFFGQATDQYGKRLDKTASKVGEISNENAFGILGTALDKSINDYGSSDTSFAKKVSKLMDKYNPEAAQASNNPEFQDILAKINPEDKAKFLQAHSEIVPTTTPIPFKDFYGDVKKLLESMDPAEHNTAILRREVGNYIAKIDPSFRKLQSEYSNVVSYREELAKIFRPYDGEAALRTGEKWMTQFGMGRDSNLTNIDRNLLRFMEEGFQGKKIKMKGLGTDVSKEFEGLSNKIDTIKREITQAKDPIFSKYAMEIADSSQAHLREMAALEAKGQLSKEQLDLRMAQIKDAIDGAKKKALFDIEVKKRIYEKARRKTHEFDESRKRIEGFINAFSFGIAGAGLFKTSRLLRAGLMARKAMRLRGRTR